MKIRKTSTTKNSSTKTSGLEHVATFIYSLRSRLSNIWRIGVLMGKGAYLLGERRRLFVKLGEITYQKFLNGEIQSQDLKPLVGQLDRLTKKVHIEEILIQKLRFGKKKPRAKHPVAESHHAIPDHKALPTKDSEPPDETYYE